MSELRGRGGIVYTTAPRTSSRGLKDVLLAGLDGALDIFRQREIARIQGRQPTGQTESTIPSQTVADRDPDDQPRTHELGAHLPLILIGIGAYWITR